MPTRLRKQQQWLRRAGGGTSGTRAGSSGQQQADLDQAQEGVQERQYARSLILAYLASLNRSLFAAKCLVEVVIEMYRQGVTLDDAKVMLSLESLQHGGQLLGPMDEDILTSWVAVIMIALQLVGVPLRPEGEERMRQLGRDNPADDTTGMIAGLRGMVQMSVSQFLAGTDLFRLQLQQSMQGQADGEIGGASPAIFMLQQNTRLVIIALEVVRGMGLPTQVSLQQPQPPASTAEEAAGAGDVAGEAATSSRDDLQERQAVLERSWVPGYVLAHDPKVLSSSSKQVQQRAAAVRMLISFMGAAQGWLYPAWQFVAECMACYRQGWTADEVFGQLQDEEFAQSGGMAALNIARLPSASQLTAAVFARWLSIVYMTLVQLGEAFPGATQQDGWAWVSGAGHQHGEDEDAGATTLEAYGLADFVLHTIRNEEQKEQAGRRETGGSGMAVEGVLARKPVDQLARREGFVSLEDPQLLSTSPSVLVMSQQISLIQMARQLLLEDRARAAAAGAGA